MTHNAEIDARCHHLRVSQIYAEPGGRWACDRCGATFHLLAPTCVIPPEVGQP